MKHIVILRNWRGEIYPHTHEDGRLVVYSTVEQADEAMRVFPPAKVHGYQAVPLPGLWCFA